MTQAGRRLLSTAKVAGRLAAAEQTMRAWVAKGLLEGVRLGDGKLARYRIESEALERLVPGRGSSVERRA